MTLARLLADGVDALGVDLSAAQQQQLLDYVGLLDKCIEGSDLEVGYRKRRGVAHVIGHGGAQRRERIVLVVRGGDGRRQRHQQILGALGHGYCRRCLGAIGLAV